MKKLILMLLFIPMVGLAQRKQLTPVGGLIRVNPFTTITGGTEQNLYGDTVPANTIMKFMRVKFRAACNITTGVGLATINIRFVNGANSIVLLSTLNIAVSQTNKPFIVEGRITNRGDGNGYLYMTVSQDGATPINTVTSYYDKRAIVPMDFTVAQPIFLKVTLAGIGLGATTVGVDEIEREGF